MNWQMHWQKLWYQKPSQFRLSLCLLIPFSFFYKFVVCIRRFFYKIGLFSKHSFPIPIIVVGNLTIGGTGKTPLVIHIAKLLKQYGWNPGIVSRGYGRKKGRGECVWVNPQSEVMEVGDEPLLMARRLSCPIVVCEDRVKAVKRLLQSRDGEQTKTNTNKNKNENVEVIVSDDGLQHYAMERTIEISVVDGLRRYGNQFCLPAGPLREPMSRLRSVDLQVVNLTAKDHSEMEYSTKQEYDMELRPGLIYNGLNSNEQKTLNDFRGQTVHAVAGIGHPVAFFRLLRSQGLNVIEHAFADHHFFSEQEIFFDDQFSILMTEKDAVKCQGKLTKKHWILSVDANINPLFDVRLLALLQDRKKKQK